MQQAENDASAAGHGREIEEALGMTEQGAGSFLETEGIAPGPSSPPRRRGFWFAPSCLADHCRQLSLCFQWKLIMPLNYRDWFCSSRQLQPGRPAAAAAPSATSGAAQPLLPFLLLPPLLLAHIYTPTS